MNPISFFSKVLTLYCLIFIGSYQIVAGQFVPAGSGSYTTVFPGVDQAGRNRFPSGSPLLSGSAANKPVPTNDWWSAKIKNNHADNLFNYPFTLKTVNPGLVVTYIPWGVIDDIIPVTVGVLGLNASRVTVSDFSDWTVTMNWFDGSRNFSATSGKGMPFIYFSKGNADVATVTVNSGTVTIFNEVLVVTNARNGADFAVYAPLGSSWTKTGNVYSSDLNGQNYWSLAFLPLTAPNVFEAANEYKKYAYVFPVNTLATWSFNEETSVLRTDFVIETVVKEGTNNQMLQGLLPHQWSNLASDSPVPNKYSYQTVRGELKMLEGNSFSVENTFYGILPTLPYLGYYSSGFDPATLNKKIQLIENDRLATWTDSYNEGQVMNRLIQTARIADLTGNTEALNKIKAVIKERLEDWLKAEAGEVAFLFYYNNTWSALLGYPAGHGQDENINDHHFHWGYFIHAAAFMEQFEPGWAANWGPMIELLIRDAANTDRLDQMFPYLRNFSPYAGHSWANGFATFPQGNDQESTSESMQFNSSLIHWGQITGNTKIRDLGIYLYTTEQTAIEEYWFDMHQRNFRPEQRYSLVSRVWGNSYDNGTFWTSDIAASYGIQMYPIHGGSLYLGHNVGYVDRLWREIQANTGIMSNQVNPNLWHDVKWKYWAFINPQGAIDLYNSYPERSLKFGISDAQTYYWLHSMNSLGRVETSITANYPIAAVFKSNDTLTYVAHNYSPNPITVNFSNGYQLLVPAKSMATSRDLAVKGMLTSSFLQAYIHGSVQLKVNITEGAATKVEFFNGTTPLGGDTQEPFVFDATGLRAAKHQFYARIYEGERFKISNIVEVVVGNQIPYTGVAAAIPGVIEAGNYDMFEGGTGQGIAYFDVTVANHGDYRLNEYVDAGWHTTEGAVVGWINAGEWLEYTVNVQQPGYYTLIMRFACGNIGGGGPFDLYLGNTKVKGGITVAHTNGWSNWATKTVTGIPLAQGENTLRLVFENGELNIGRLTFSYTSPLDFSQPVANAGNNRVVILPQTTAVLDGSASFDPLSQPLSYSWTQVYGPSVIQFVDNKIVEPHISNLVEGVYLVRLIVSNGNFTDDDELFVIVSPTSEIAPVISLTSPANNLATSKGRTIILSASASDLDGTISRVSFFQNKELIAHDETAPYSVEWVPTTAGVYEIYASTFDNAGNLATSQSVGVSVAEVMKCTETSNQASQGSFTTGYIASFETIGNNVEITFELLDARTGVVAYLWKQWPFSEVMMENIGGRKFRAVVAGVKTGERITYACKFAFSGGMSVTKFITYEVGTSCGNTSVQIIDDRYVNLFPNPTDGLLNLSNIPLNTVITIYDLAGRVVLSEKTKYSTQTIDVSALDKGIYLVQLSSNSGKITRRFVKQ